VLLNYKLSDSLSWAGVNVKIVCERTGPYSEIAKEWAEKSRTIVYVDLIHGVRRSPSKANVADRVAQRHRDIERRAESTVRHDEISGRRGRSWAVWRGTVNKATGDGADGRVLDRIKVVKEHGSWNRSGESTLRINGD